MSIIVSDLSYHYFNQDSLFEHINLSVSSNSKVSLVGNNGTGKSTLLKIIGGELLPSLGSIICSSKPYYIPQQVGFNDKTIAEALCVDEKISAMKAIISGSVEQIHYDTLADEWDIEERSFVALSYWGLSNKELDTKMNLLSGGERTKVMLAGLMIHKPDIILLDEPTNHLDYSSRENLYSYIKNIRATIVIVSHDITLLNMIDTTYELSGKGLRLYGGNYDFYKQQRKIEFEALKESIQNEEAGLRLAKKKAQEMRERQERRNSSGKKRNADLPRIVKRTLADWAEQTGAKLNEIHYDKINDNQERIKELREKQANLCELKIDFSDADLHNGKLLIGTKDVNFEYNKDKLLWKENLSLEIRSGERIQITGDNGKGKTTLLKLLIGDLQPTKGNVESKEFSYVYLDQEYSAVNVDMSILELAQNYNSNNLLDHEIKLRLNRALFLYDTWDKNCMTLSGGEKMRLLLCSLMISNNIPDVFILDEPTNNLDISSLNILTQTIKNYRGTVLVISHDKHFVQEIGVSRVMALK